MPKHGAEPIRKAALINAAITAVGRAGSLDVTVARIARDAGMSPALAHHYFGSKDRIFLAAMRHILTQYGVGVRAGLAGVADPRARVDAIIHASFSGRNFERDTIAAWLNFYVLALTDAQAARLLAIYRRRLCSNLVHALRPLAGGRAQSIADTLGALIDGVYLHAVLDPQAPDPGAAQAMVARYLDEVL